jgi:hypothetical protein
MAFGNNRAAARPRANFQAAGGTVMKLRNPMLSGQISGASPVDEIDVSRACKLNDTFLDAEPAQDHSIMETLVDGSTITITNHSLAGTLTLQVLRTTGFVGTGDFIAAAHLIIASKDTVGSTFTVIETIDDRRLVTIFYGASFKNVPVLKKAGNAVVPYPVVMNYSGWVQGSSAGEINEKAIWAVGNKVGLKGIYKPYAVQEGEKGGFYDGKPLSVMGGVGAGSEDTSSGDIDGVAKAPESADGVNSSAEYSNWPAE